MEPKLVVVSLWAEDVGEAARFYQDAIGLHSDPHHGPRPHFKLGEIYLTILQGRPRPAEQAQPPRFPLLAFSVDDLTQAMNRLEAKGVAFPWGIEEDGGSRWVLFHDPAGNLIEFVEFQGSVGNPGRSSPEHPKPSESIHS